MKEEQKKKIFVSFEGIEGCGKTTQANILYKRLKKDRYKVILTKEPGGTPISDDIRDILLKPKYKNIHCITELLLYNASRTQHYTEIIQPSLDKGYIVITDRFTDSTYAYQGYGRNIKLSVLNTLNKIAVNKVRTDITLLFDLDVEIGLKRNKCINKINRLELENINFHNKVRQGFLRIAKKEPERIKIIDATKSIDSIKKEVWAYMMDFIEQKKT